MTLFRYVHMYFNIKLLTDDCAGGFKDTVAGREISILTPILYLNPNMQPASPMVEVSGVKGSN